MAPRQKCGPMPKAEVVVRRPADVEAVGVGEDRPRRGWPTRRTGRPCRPRGSSARRARRRAVAVRWKRFTGVTQRSISSTAVGSRAGSACRRARSSGCSMRASRPPEIRFRVVSLPATRSSMKKELNSCERQAVAVDLAVHQLARQVVARVGHAIGGQLVGVHEELGGGDLRRHRDRAGTRDRRRPIIWLLHWSTRCRSSSGTPTSSTMTRSGSSAEIGVDEVALAGARDLIDDARRDVPHVLLEPADHAAREAEAHQPPVAWCAPAGRG